MAGLEKLKNLETMRASSSDTNWVSGNADMRRIKPGDRLTLAEQDGPFYGTPLWEGCEAGARSTASRFHLVNPVVFKK